MMNNFTEAAAHIHLTLPHALDFDSDRFIEAAVHRLLSVRKALRTGDSPTRRSPGKVSRPVIDLTPFHARSRIFSENLN